MILCYTDKDRDVHYIRLKTASADGGKNYMKILTKLINNETGATAIEYGLIAALIFLAIVVSLNTFADSMGNLYNDISNTVTNTL